MIETFWNICLLHAISSRDQLLREAIRVIRTKQQLEQQDVSAQSISGNPETLFRWMKEHVGERELGHFPGDPDLFARLYQVGKEINLLEYAARTLQQDRSTIIVNPGIIHTWIDLCERKNYQTLLITEAEKYIRGLHETKVFTKPYTITLLTENYTISRLLKTYFASYPNVTVMQASIYQPIPLERKFQAILTIPNFGLKVNDDEELTIRDSEAVAVRHLLPLVEDDGTLCAILPARMMFQSGNLAEWRKQVHQAASVKSIYLLPEGFFRPHTSVKMYQVEFSKAKSDRVTVGQLQVRQGRLTVEQESTMPSDQFQQLEHWRIDLLLNVKQDELQLFQQTKTSKVKLREVAEIFRGKSILKQDLKPGHIRVLNISNLVDGEVVLNGLETIDEEERKVKRYELAEGDLVMTCRGTVFKLAVFPKADGIVIASANILVIRFKSRIQSHFAKMFLESPTGTALIQSFQRGTTVMNLNPSDIADIELPMLPEEKQTELIQRYVEEKERYRRTVREATERWEQIRNELYKEIY